MSDIENEDSLTKLNTQLNKSMVLMDTSMKDVQSPNKSNRSIKINTKAQPARVSNGRASETRKSILKKTKNNNSENVESEAARVSTDSDDLNCMDVSALSSSFTKISRPQNLKDLIKQESLIINPADATINFDDVCDDEDIWIMDMPRTVDPQELIGQTLTFGDKSKFKIGEEKYYATNHDPKCRVTCVFRSGQKKQYKTVNVRPVGTMAIRRKLPNTKKVVALCTEEKGVPFPENLKTRHPLFGVTYDGKVIKGKRKSNSIGKQKKLQQS